MYECWVDGSVRGNPGIGGIGIVVKHNGAEVRKRSKIVGDHITNNEAEYKAVIEGIKILKSINVDKERCTIYTDSKVVHGQIVDGWKVNYPHLKKLCDKAKREIAGLDFYLDIQRVDREDNSGADKLAQSVTSKRKKERELCQKSLIK